MNRRFVFYALVALCALFGAILYREIAAPADVAPPPAAGATPERPSAALPRPPENREDQLATITARPLFSPTRRPPEGDAGVGSTGLDNSRLTAIVTEPGRRLAIFAMPDAKPLVLGEGETLNGWRVDSITPLEVSLTGPEGTRTLQPKADPNLPVKPPPQAKTQAALPGAPPPVRPVIRPALPLPPPGAHGAPRLGLTPAAPASRMGRE